MNEQGIDELSRSLLNEKDQIVWISMGLTSDVQSLENAALITKVQFEIVLHLLHLIKNLFSVY